MNITLQRTDYSPKATIGNWIVDGTQTAYTLEDVVRPAGAPKVWGQTAIPAGRYQVIIDNSDHFKRLMPHVLNVPGFEAIRIHNGNSDVDTDGCILLGLTKMPPDWIGQSVPAFDAFFDRLTAELATGGECWLEIVDGEGAP